MRYRKGFLVLLLLCICLKSVSSKGCVPLDSYSFEKIVSKFKASLVKFDTAYPYGKQQDEYEKVCMASKDIDDLLVAEVAVKDYGEKDNAELAEKYGVVKEDFPLVKLFIDGSEDAAATFKAEKEQDFTEENLKEFVRAKSKVYIGLQGCLEEFDKAAEEFTNAKSKDEKKKLLIKTEALWGKMKGKQRQQLAEVYVKYMRKSLEVGDGFVENETKRVKNIVKGKISKEKKEELEQKINILRAFRPKDEL